MDKINTKIVYATLIELSDRRIEKEEIEKIILIKVPSEIYTEIRKIFIYLLEASGFKDVKINKNVDFERLYSLKKAQ